MISRDAPSRWRCLPGHAHRNGDVGRDIDVAVVMLAAISML